jgi:single-stranded DNA-specific DHH superfamily exonuclease
MFIPQNKLSVAGKKNLPISNQIEDEEVKVEEAKLQEEVRDEIQNEIQDEIIQYVERPTRK